MRPPILLTGAARSGTSMTAGVVHLCGAWGGRMSGPNRNNARGMFENANIRSIVKAYLREHGHDPLGQFPLPDVPSIMIPRDWKQQVEGVMFREGYNKDKDLPWFYKGAKMCLMWPVWKYAFPDAKWIIVRRKTADIVQSCIKTGFMRAFDRPFAQKAVGVKTPQDGWLWWVHQHEQRFREMLKADLDVRIVWPERMVGGDYEQMRETIEWLGLEWKDDAVRNFIEPKLWKAKYKKGLVDTPKPVRR